jgi:hypothetical protein
VTLGVYHSGKTTWFEAEELDFGIIVEDLYSF